MTDLTPTATTIEALKIERLRKRIDAWSRLNQRTRDLTRRRIIRRNIHALHLEIGRLENASN